MNARKSPAERIVLGLYQGYNANACLVVGGRPLVVVEKERLFRTKHAYGSALECVSACLDFAGATLGDVDSVAFCGASDLDTDYGYDVVFPEELAGAFPASKGVRLLANDCHRETAIRLFDRVLPAVMVEHHVAHGAASFFTSDAHEAVVLAYDGFGDFGRSCLVLKGSANRLRCIESVPLRVGLAFKKAGTHLYRLSGSGFDSAGKIMALAACGEPRHMEAAQAFIRAVDRQTGIRELVLPEFGRVQLGAFRDLSAPLARDFAASLQTASSEAVVSLLRRHLSSGESLCLSGGCALNVIINRDLVDEFALADLHVPPWPHDGGLGLGAALYVEHQLEGMNRTVGEPLPYLGATDLDSFGVCDFDRIPVPVRGSVRVRQLDEPERLRLAVDLLAGGEAIGWCRGRSEAGPRALGNRSILADPSRADMAEHLNRRVKQREAFRPYGLSIREENLGDLFPNGTRSPFMVMAGAMPAHWQTRLPATVHVDGTTRYHTVARGSNPVFWELLHAIEREKGVPGLLNTSYNLRGEPLAETATDCLRTFRDTMLDHLFLGTLYLGKR